MAVPAGVAVSAATDKRQTGAPAAPVDGERPRRLTHSEIIGMLLSRSERRPTSTVTLTRNAKGETQIEVTVPTGVTDEVATPNDAAELCAAIYSQLRQQFPLASGFVGAQTPAGGETKGGGDAT